MANQWFRLYGEFSHDPKVQMLSEIEQRRLVMLFCLRCNGDVTLQDEEVTFQLRISDDEWSKSKATFIARGFINEDNEVLNWNKRQYVSDSSAERVAKYRAKKISDVTLSNVTVTPPEQNRTEQIQNRTDTEQMHKRVKKSKTKLVSNYDDYPEFSEFWSNYPIKEGKLDAFKSWIALSPSIDKVLHAIQWQRTSKKWRDGYIPMPATYLNQGRWQDEAPLQESPF
jgi:hypothetical protein